MRLSLTRLLKVFVPVVVLVACAADAPAGPLRDRLRARRSGGCTPTFAPPTGSAVGGGCPGGKCPIR